MDIPTSPALFGKFANSLSAQGADIALPPVDFKYDYEAELGVVIGREAREVSQADALGYVAGYCCINDLSARGMQLATSQWMAGKILDGFLPTGPFLVTADDIPNPQDLGIRCFVNGTRQQNSSTADMIFSVAAIIAYLSRLLTLKPGDVIATGTPEGVLLGKPDPEWLKPGDEVSVEIDGLGRLTNRLVAPL
jgi:2-keto-4-pentenoate hydratase/2-oxohepta-3-ene-1,7-dioic acid hydratase in catechol pathway